MKAQGAGCTFGKRILGFVNSPRWHIGQNNEGTCLLFRVTLVGSTEDLVG